MKMQINLKKEKLTMEKKFYSFCVLNNAKTKKGDDFVAATVKGVLCNIDQKEVDGKTLVSGNLGISNRTDMLKTYLGDNIEEKNGTVWVNVTMWEKTAERFLKCLGDNEKLTVVLCGSLRCREYKAENETRHTVDLSVVDFSL